VGRKPQVRLRWIEDLKRGTNKDIGLKGIFELASNTGPGKTPGLCDNKKNHQGCFWIILT
jgi:hypothetical protein